MSIAVVPVNIPHGVVVCTDTDGATWGPNWVLPPLAPAALYRFACRCMYVINSCISRTMHVVADQWITAYKYVNPYIVYSSWIEFQLFIALYIDRT